jgi:hypothetical protein
MHLANLYSQERIFSYRVGEARGRPLASMLSKEFHALFRGAIEQGVETGGATCSGRWLKWWG